MSRILQIRFRSLISCGQPCPHLASSPVSEADRSIGLSDDKISTNRKWAIYDTSSRPHVAGNSSLTERTESQSHNVFESFRSGWNQELKTKIPQAHQRVKPIAITAQEDWS